MPICITTSPNSQAREKRFPTGTGNSMKTDTESPTVAMFSKEFHEWGESETAVSPRTRPSSYLSVSSVSAPRIPLDRPFTECRHDMGGSVDLRSLSLFSENQNLTSHPASDSLACQVLPLLFLHFRTMALTRTHYNLTYQDGNSVIRPSRACKHGSKVPFQVLLGRTTGKAVCSRRSIPNSNQVLTR